MFKRYLYIEHISQQYSVKPTFRWDENNEMTAANTQHNAPCL